jgi:GTP-binding protein
MMTVAPDLSAVALEVGRKLFAQNCEFILGVASDAQLPEGDLQEIGFAGRSNVGKSSLINALTGRKALARTSNTPGRTRQLNFFDLGGRLNLVDLPGYGYARAAKREVAAWNELILSYLRGRPQLARVCLLIDARHGFKPNDLEIMALLDQAAVSYQIVLTKADKVPEGPLKRLVGELEPQIRKHPACFPTVIATSSSTGAGIGELRAELASFAAAQ